MACIIYTGSPNYELPDDLIGFKQVNNSVFIKPCENLIDIEEALIYQINKCSVQMIFS